MFCSVANSWYVMFFAGWLKSINFGPSWIALNVTLTIPICYVLSRWFITYFWCSIGTPASSIYSTTKRVLATSWLRTPIHPGTPPTILTKTALWLTWKVCIGQCWPWPPLATCLVPKLVLTSYMWYLNWSLVSSPLPPSLDTLLISSPMSLLPEKTSKVRYLSHSVYLSIVNSAWS